MKVIKRDGRIVSYDGQKIINAIEKAMKFGSGIYKKEVAIQIADVIIFLTDIKQGVTAADKDIALMLKKSKKKIILVCNKADNFGNTPDDIYEFYNLGIGEPIAISAANANGAKILSTSGTVKPPYCWLAAAITISPITSNATSSDFGSLYHKLPISNPSLRTDATSNRQQFIVSRLADIS